jgi:uncharacterized protein YceH (UPF0502 family)
MHGSNVAKAEAAKRRYHDEVFSKDEDVAARRYDLETSKKMPVASDKQRRVEQLRHRLDAKELDR